MYISLEEMGRYLYYDASNAIDVTTDFRSCLDIHSHYDSSSDFFKATTIHFDGDSVIVFDLNATHPSLSSDMTIPRKKKRWLISKTPPSTMMPEFNSKPIRSTKSMFTCPTSTEETPTRKDYIFTREHSPRCITPGPIGYCVSGYNLHVVSRPPTSYIVYDINGNETQEPMVKMNLFNPLRVSV